MTLDEAKPLTVQILSKTLNVTELTADKGIIISYTILYVSRQLRLDTNRPHGNQVLGFPKLARNLKYYMRNKLA